MHDFAGVPPPHPAIRLGVIAPDVTAGRYAMRQVFG
jgi:hypothetical protein